ncbi:MAG TPA: LTA synthase family protein, partial [Flavobacterium sp.]
MLNLKSLKIPRLREYQVLFYRIGLAYLFYFIARVLFTLYNTHLIPVTSIGEFFQLYWHGLVFDTTAILYINSLFILLSILPLVVNTRSWYQKVLLWLYFVTNLLAYATNFIDFIYYRFNFGRSTIAITDSIAHESNKMLLFLNFAKNYWHVFLLFLVCS